MLKSSPTIIDNDNNKLNICMISDFFYPGFGGVESHIYCLSTELIKRGHKVIVITTSYEDRRGIRYLSNGIKVYHLPIFKANTPAGSTTFPFGHTIFPLFRNIMLREQINIVHGHQCTSNLCNESILHGKTMGLKCFFTDHSLFGFGDEGGIHINKVSRFVLSEVDHVICVTNTLKENLALRASINPFKMTVIPHAVDSGIFHPIRSEPPSKKERLKIISVGRLVYRRGVDLLAAIIPVICKKYPFVDFIIVGDGPKKIELLEMIEKNELFQRVEMLGGKPHSEIPKLLQQSHVYINTSLTEAFGMAILEAACSGLFVISTNVGGIREVLPNHDLILLSDPNPFSFIETIDEAIEKFIYKSNPIETHLRVKEMYTWDKVAENTELVYLNALKKREEISLLDRLLSYETSSFFHGKICALMMAFDYLIYQTLEWFYPREEIDTCPSFPLFQIDNRSIANPKK
ncbi:hypothetical protein ABK040_007176 [Willaertia magna]